MSSDNRSTVRTKDEAPKDVAKRSQQQENQNKNFRQAFKPNFEDN